MKILAILLLTCTNAFAGRVVMEGIDTTNSTIFVDTTNTKVGISTNTPAYRLDVYGDVRSTGTFYGKVSALAVDLSTVTTALAAKLDAPATFYVVKTSDYLVAPASFTYQATGNYITSLTGGVTASGPGAAAATVVSVPTTAVDLSTVTARLDVLDANVSTAAHTNAVNNFTGADNNFVSLTASTLTITGSSFSVGGSTLVVANGRVGVGQELDIIIPFAITKYNPAPLQIAARGSGEYSQIWYNSSYVYNGGIYHSASTGGNIYLADATGADKSVYRPTQVGINTTTPGSTLHVNGDITGGSITASSFTATGAALVSGQLNVGGLANLTNGALIKDSGNTGLILEQGSSAVDRMRIFVTDGSGGYAGDENYIESLNTGLHFSTAANATSEIVTFLPTGNVGIGTASPSTILEVREADRGNGAYAYGNVNIFTTDASAAGKGGSIGLGGSTGQATSPFLFARIRGPEETTNSYNGYLAFDTNSGGALAERVRVTSAGNVGIGTTGPSGKLHVVPGEAIFGAAASAAAGDGWNYNGSRGVYATNVSGFTLSSGAVLTYDYISGAAVAVTTAPANTNYPVGTLYDDSCANGAVCRVCTEGICYARIVTDEGCAVAADRYVIVGDQDGRAQCTTAPDATTHNREIGQPASFNAATTGPVIQIWAHRN